MLYLNERIHRESAKLTINLDSHVLMSDSPSATKGITGAAEGRRSAEMNMEHL